MRISDLVSVSPTPLVVSLSHIERLKYDWAKTSVVSEEPPIELQRLLTDYSITEQDNLCAVESLLESFARKSGEAAMVYGHYGAGKSHLLAVLGLLAEFPECWRYFINTHPEFAAFEPLDDKKFLVVSIALDEYSTPNLELEEIVFREIERALACERHDIWAPLVEESYFLELFDKSVYTFQEKEFNTFLRRRNSPANWKNLKRDDPVEACRAAQAFLQKIELPLDCRRSRAEAVVSLQKHLAAKDYAGVIVLLDELSTFFASKDKRSLNRDGAFLQFLAQQCDDNKLWLVATAQRSLEDLGDIDSHTLRQVRDRFRKRFTLSISEIRKVLTHRVVKRHNTGEFNSAIGEIYERYERGDERLYFSKEELAATYPVNPLVLDCLESLAANFLSSTRSLIGIVQRGLLEGEALFQQDAARLLTLDEIFMLEESELLALPEARKYRQAWDFFRRNLSDTVEATDLEKSEIILKTLLLVSMAGFRWNTEKLATALCGCYEKSLWGAAAEIERILKRIWRRGAYLDLARSVEPGGNEYFLDVDTDISENVRRRINEVLAALGDDDARIVEYGLQTMDREELPLAHFTVPRAMAVTWQGTKRYVNVCMRRPSSMKQTEAEETVATLAAEHCREDGALFISLPGIEPEREAAAWQDKSSKLKGRFKNSLLVWVPRALKEDEFEILCENAALKLLSADNTLAKSRKGREVRVRIAARLSETKEECRKVLQRAYLAGEVLCAASANKTVPATLAAESWEELVGDLFQNVFKRLFPRFVSVAPRRKLPGRGQTNQLVERFIRPGQLIAEMGGSLQELLEDVLVPIGFADRTDGQWRVASKPTALMHDMLSLFPEPTPEPEAESVIAYRLFEGRLRKGEWGLSPEMIELAAACLIRCGYLRGLDGFLQPLHFSQIAFPLTENLPFLMKSSPLSKIDKSWMEELGRRLFAQDNGAADPAQQEALWDRFKGWQRRARRDLPELQEALENFLKTLGQEDFRWTQSSALFVQMKSLLEVEIEGTNCSSGLQLFLESAKGGVVEELRVIDILERFARLRQFLRQYAPALGQAYRMLNDARLSLPEKSALARESEEVLQEMAEGEAIIPTGDQLCSTWAKLHQAYKKRYCAWHAQQNNARRFQPLLQIKIGKTFELAQRLASAGGDKKGDFTKLTTELEAALARHCSGVDLPGSLETMPVCPRCGLRLGEELSLCKPTDFNSLLNTLIEPMLQGLFNTKNRELLLERARDEECAELSERLKSIFTAAKERNDELLLELLSPEVAQWVSKQLLMRIAGKRKLVELAKRLGKRKMTKKQALSNFMRWLDADECLGEEDLVIIE